LDPVTVFDSHNGDVADRGEAYIRRMNPTLPAIVQGRYSPLTELWGPGDVVSLAIQGDVPDEPLKPAACFVRIEMADDVG
jgi:hypothetical protein